MLKFQGKVTDLNGNPVPGAQLTISKTNVITPLPVIYAIADDGSITAAANPFNSDANGEYVFAIESGTYSIEATGSAAVLNISKTITQFTPSDATAASTAVAVTLQSQTFLASSSWTCPIGVTQATVTCVGGGAGGRAGGNGIGTAGSGGGGGATVVRQIPVSPGVTYAIVIGGGGTAGAPSLGVGTAGGNTTFGTLVTANGAPAPGALTGTPGTGTTAGYGGPIGASVVADTSEPIINGRGIICSGGSAPGPALNGNDVETYAGGPAGASGGTNPGGGGGGATPFGGGGAGGGNPTDAAVGGAGTAALANSGAGGGGGASGATTGGASGAGGSGLCIVEWIS